MLRPFAVALMLASTALARDGLELGVPCPCHVVQHTGFSLCYSEPYEQASWVAYVLTAGEIKARSSKRNEMRWQEDPTVPTGSAKFDDYRKSGFDKGHLAPAADMRWSATAMRESFLLSNASPQVHALNSGVWEDIENAVRNFAVAHDSVYVVTGPVLRPGLPTIGRDKVAVPEYFYKVVLARDGEAYQGIGFVCRNQSMMLPLDRFVVTIDSVEALTGLNFFGDLPAKLQDQAEGRVNLKWWLPQGKKLPKR